MTANATALRIENSEEDVDAAWAIISQLAPDDLVPSIQSRGCSLQCTWLIAASCTGQLDGRDAARSAAATGTTNGGSSCGSSSNCYGGCYSGSYSGGAASRNTTPRVEACCSKRGETKKVRDRCSARLILMLVCANPSAATVPPAPINSNPLL